ncbi:hypothetical protein F4860DRAFT_463520 [Xylaria cubensis]|nr:hypothetical protein F4860DRAFT_463520 [Xylaria cubensis]
MDLDQPLIPPPDGVTQNLHDPPSNRALAYVTLVITISTSGLSLGLRLYSDIFKARKVRKELFLASSAYITYLAFCACAIWGLGFITFIHTWDIRYRDLMGILHQVHVATCFYAATMLGVKSAILLEWIRIFVPRGTRNYFFWTAYVLIVLNVGFYSSAIVAASLSCIPERAIWDLRVKGKCINPRAIDIAGAAINVVIDFSIFILAQRVIWTLHMTPKKKIGVSLTFGVGLFACFAAIFRLVESVKLNGSKDQVYDSAPTALWAIGEMASAFIIFSAPSIPRLFRHHDGLMSRIFKNRSSSSSRRQKGAPSSNRPQDITPVVDGDHPYRVIHEATIASEESHGTQLAVLRAPYQAGDSVGRGGVLCSRDFSVTVEYNPDEAKDLMYRNHYG